MPDGLWIRITITLLAAAQAMIAAVLGFGEILPQEWKIGLIVVSAGLAVVINQVPSWTAAPGVARAMKRARVD